MKKIALLSHRGGNIGHDFMAIGMEIALREAFGSSVCIDHFEQHNPFEVYPEEHWLRWMHKLPHGRMSTLLRGYLNKPSSLLKFWPQTSALDYDLAVASGGPNIVPGGSNSAELGLMLHHMNGAFHYRGVPLLDAGVGASFPIESIPQELQDPDDFAFYKRAAELCQAIAVRDTTAQKVIRKLGFEPWLIPCGAIGTGRVFEMAHPIDGEARKYVLINFQRLGANTDWGQRVNPTEWMRTIQLVIDDLGKRHPVLLLAQNSYEKKLASQLAPHVRCILPSSTDEYANVINMAKVGLVSRIHAAIPLAGIGIPSVVIGTDTRLGTVEQMGLPTRFVKEATYSWIVDEVEGLLKIAESERQRLLALRENTIQQYVTLFRDNVKVA